MKTIKSIKFLSIILLFPLFIEACHEKENQEQDDTKNPKSVTLSDAQLKQVMLDTANAVSEESELILTGKISFDEDKVAKVYPLVSGNVLKVNVSLGDYVKRGDVIAVLRSADISSIQNQYEVALSNMQMMKKNKDIAEELYKSNVNSEKDFMNAQNEYKKAKAEVNHLKEQLDIYGAKDNATDAEYRVLAPIEGYIVEKNISENMEIRSDNASNIFTVSSLKTVWVLADVYESDLTKVKIGESVDVTTIAYPGKIFQGTISQVANLLDPQTKTLKIRIVMDNPDGLLKPEMFANVKVHIPMPAKLISVPSSSVVFDGNHYYVMVRSEKNKFEKREVEPGTHTANLTFISNGIKAGEIIVTEGSLLAENN